MTNLNDLRRQAMVSHSRGNLDQAAAGYAAVLAESPGDFEALFLNGLLEGQRRNFQAAVELLQRAHEVDPAHGECSLNLARALRAAGKLEAALDVTEQALKVSPDDPNWLSIKTSVLSDLGRADEAVVILDQLLLKHPKQAEAWLDRGLIFQSQGNWIAALESYQKARASNPTIASHHLHEAQALLVLNRNQEAREAFDRVVQIDANMVAGHLGRGMAMLRLHNVVGALLSGDKARQLDPNSAQAHYILGCGEAELGHLEQGLSFLDEALQRDADHADTHFAKGEILQKLNRYEEAAQLFTRARELNPKLSMATGNLLDAQLWDADWRNFDALLGEVKDAIRAGTPVISPASLLALTDDPELLLTHAKSTAARFFPPVPKPLARPRPAERDALHVGFVVADLGDSLTGAAWLNIWEQRDRSKLNLTLIDTGLNDESAVRARLEATADKFLVVTDLSDSEAATRIAALQLDVLINLGGYFHQARPGIFAFRPCSVQATHSYPSTMGTDYIDYLITDRKSIKSGTESAYSEKLIYLPEIALAAHAQAESSTEQPTRAALELPENAFIFACLQSANRISPMLFQSWMRILAAVPDSVLMLREGSPSLKENLAQAASDAGVASDRLVFTSASTQVDYFNRLRLADLCLDTFPWVSADPLSVGAPIVTIEGSSLNSRLTAAALDHLGALELIASDANHYEKIAIEMATDKQKLAKTKSKITAATKSAAMFNAKKLAYDWQKTLALLVSG